MQAGLVECTLRAHSSKRGWRGSPNGRKKLFQGNMSGNIAVYYLGGRLHGTMKNKKNNKI
jgi:hypothetical protein